MKKPASAAKSKLRRGRPQSDLLRWNLKRASLEFGQHRESLEKKRRMLGIEPGPDGCFSSRDIAAMLFGDKEAEQIGLLAAQRVKAEIEGAQLARTLILRKDARLLWADGWVKIRQCLAGAEYIPPSDRERLARDLLALDVAELHDDDALHD